MLAITDGKSKRTKRHVESKVVIMDFMDKIDNLDGNDRRFTKNPLWQTMICENPKEEDE